jgi:hypothetical protein
MPTIPQQQTIVQYIANSSQTQYTFAFYAFNQANINVYYQAANATPIPSADILTLGSQYTVTFNSDPTTGGYITLLFTPTSGYYLTIALNLIPTLNTNFANAQNFNGANLDAALDYLLMLCQQNLNYALQRNLSYVINTYLPNAVPYTQLPPLPQNYVWMGSGSGVVAAQIATIPSASVLQSLLANNSPGTDGARLVGYYDTLTSSATTVHAFLALLSQFMATTNVQSYSANDTGTANALAIAVTASGFALAKFQVFLVDALHTITGASTIAINGGSPITIVDGLGNATTNNMIVAGQMCLFVYDGTNMQLVNPNKILFGGSMYMGNSQSIPGNTTILIAFSTANINPVGIVNAGANGFTINKAGYYRVNCNVYAQPRQTTGECWIDLHKNTVTLLERLAGASYNAVDIVLSGSTIIQCSVNDLITVVFGNGNSNAITIGNASSYLTNFDIEYLGS